MELKDLVSPDDYLVGRKNNIHNDRTFVFAYNFREQDDFAGFISFILKNILASNRYNYEEGKSFNGKVNLLPTDFNLKAISFTFDLSTGLNLEIIIYDEILTLDDGVRKSTNDSTFNFNSNIEVGYKTENIIKDLLINLYFDFVQYDHFLSEEYTELYPDVELNNYLPYYNSLEENDEKIQVREFMDEKLWFYPLWDQLDMKIENNKGKIVSKNLELNDDNCDNKIKAILDYLNSIKFNNTLNIILIPKNIYEPHKTSKELLETVIKIFPNLVFNIKDIIVNTNSIEFNLKSDVKKSLIISSKQITNVIEDSRFNFNHSLNLAYTGLIIETTRINTHNIVLVGLNSFMGFEREALYI